MKLVAHGSPRVLEQELLDRVAAAKSESPLSSVLIVVPSRRLADHVTRRLIDRFGALLDVSVVHHRVLGERVAASTGLAWRHLLDDDLLEALFARVIQRAPSGVLRDFVRARPGAASALRGTLTDLREAGLDPEPVTAALARTDPEIAALYDRWTEALAGLARDGHAIDDAWLARQAIPRAAEFGARFATILHHGAYDLIGVRIELLRALDRGREVTFLLPADPDAPSGAFGVERARALAGSGVTLARVDRELPLAAVDFTHAQGARAEMQSAVYEALAAVASGVPPEDIAIIVRSFGPYAAALDALIDTGGPAWNTSYARPLRRDPKVAAALRAIAAGTDSGPRGMSGHAEEFDAIAREAAGGDALAPRIDSLRGVETILGDTRKVSRAEARAWLEARVDSATAPPEGADGGGVRVLDAMQARGMTFQHLGLAGMNSGIFPRIAREDPFLSDASRRLLREASGRPLPIAAESDGEERLLLALLLRQAGRRTQVSWRRADEEARPLVPSLALREIAPKAYDAARPLPAHPRSRLRAWAHATGVIDARDETLLAGLASESGGDGTAAVAARRPDLAAGLALIAETESFAGPPGRYDGRIGVPLARKSMDVTALERLGRCPLRFFFRDVLRVEAPRKPPTPFTDDSRTVGERIHETLRRVYARLVDEHAFDALDVDARIARARTILRAAWTESLEAHPTARGASLPVLDGIEAGIWLRSLDAFLEADLSRIAEEGLVPGRLEHAVEGPIPGGPPGFSVRARFDRVLGGGAAAVIGDYKTGGKLSERVARSAMLSGAELQVPLYALIAGCAVDLLGVGPRQDGETVRFAGFKTTEDRDGILETLRVAVATAEAGRFPIHPAKHCASCDYRSACRRGHPPTEFREQLAEDVRDARDSWRKTSQAPTLAAVRQESAS